jgi:hypothetical protein
LAGEIFITDNEDDTPSIRDGSDGAVLTVGGFLPDVVLETVVIPEMSSSPFLMGDLKILIHKHKYRRQVVVLLTCVLILLNEKYVKLTYTFWSEISMPSFQHLPLVACPILLAIKYEIIDDYW